MKKKYISRKIKIVSNFYISQKTFNKLLFCAVNNAKETRILEMEFRKIVKWTEIFYKMFENKRIISFYEHLP